VLGVCGGGVVGGGCGGGGVLGGGGGGGGGLGGGGGGGGGWGGGVGGCTQLEANGLGKNRTQCKRVGPRKKPKPLDGRGRLGELRVGPGREGIRWKRQSEKRKKQNSLGTL